MFVNMSNMFQIQFGAGLSRIMVGGEHERWALPGDDEDGEEGEAGQRRRKEQQGDVPKVRALLWF